MCYGVAVVYQYRDTDIEKECCGSVLCRFLAFIQDSFYFHAALVSVQESLSNRCAGKAIGLYQNFFFCCLYFADYGRCTSTIRGEVYSYRSGGRNLAGEDRDYRVK